MSANYYDLSQKISIQKMLLNLKIVRSIDTLPVALFFGHIDDPFLRVKEVILGETSGLLLTSLLYVGIL